MDHEHQCAAHRFIGQDDAEPGLDEFLVVDDTGIARPGATER
ncbi:MAG TPA: hypothetical protein VGQ89_07355 [Candidatus Limnocylindrales bacterium]|nr:hypothetical protein [Candidatus Limnocylindrales bacterium]